MKLQCLIIDDEPIAQEIIEKYLEPFNQVQIVGKCHNAIEANQLLQDHPIDLIFLDIEMPHVNGISFAKSLEHPPKIIITTAYREYAIDGFELNVVDYLLKPISQERFLKALNRVMALPVNTIQSKPYIYLRVDMKMVQVYLDEIVYIQGLSNYVRVFCKDRTLITYQKLSYLEDVLPAELFIRSHRSYIVNISKIKSYTGQDLDVGSTSIPIGGNHKDAVLKILKSYNA
ncbi:LytR/AlgR family response regulator transcription factor [Ekhidna sp.]|uniref:LytR/AlgR family response regulator transcription factor n=1 Tax=Ekhidna sp. TaxID=2608089 RepID=UPI003BAC9A57